MALRKLTYVTTEKIVSRIADNKAKFFNHDNSRKCRKSEAKHQ